MKRILTGLTFLFMSVAAMAEARGVGLSQVASDKWGQTNVLHHTLGFTTIVAAIYFFMRAFFRFLKFRRDPQNSRWGVMACYIILACVLLFVGVSYVVH